jgi:hypothetical protein
MSAHRVACCVCGRPCVPLADYDTPTCIRCDHRHELVVLRLLQTNATAMQAPSWMASVMAAAARHMETGDGPGETLAVAELVDAVVPMRRRRNEQP